MLLFVLCILFGKYTGEWLKVKYSERKFVKLCDIQRYSQEIRLILDEIENDDESNKDTVISSDSF